MVETISHVLGDTRVDYLIDTECGRVGLRLIPNSMVDLLVKRRSTLVGEPEIDLLPEAPPRAWDIDAIAQLKIIGDDYTPGFGQGHTMLSSPSNFRFRYHSQEVTRNAKSTVIETQLLDTSGLSIKHRLFRNDGEDGLRVRTSFSNHSGAHVCLEMLSSFCLGDISPFCENDAPERLMVHRFRSVWSAEGRLESRSIEDMHLERSWSGASALSERFGQVGSMPVRRWFPFVAIEDTEAKVTWAASLAWAGSWQMEVFRRHDNVSLSGGQADREFGHWMKTVAPGELLEMPEARLACAEGGVDAACDRLIQMGESALNEHPQVEAELPVIFNEWCTTWGYPSAGRMESLASRLSGTGVKYLVIDAGWYQGEKGNWSTAHGDWIPSEKLFTDGLKAVSDMIRAYGLIPGLWFEMETVGDCSEAFHRTDLLLCRDGIPVTVRNRRFWDLNNPKAIDYLTERVIHLLRDCEFGFLKVDYNETIGLGCDHSDGVGEGLRQQTLGMYRFFEKIRMELPELVIENCSSGGHRLEPSMLEATAISSFSDAHETMEIPIVAANLHRIVLPRQSEIWAVLHSSDSRQRLVYSLTATFLGRMALSGEIDRLSDVQWTLVREAVGLYQNVASIIRDGRSEIADFRGNSWRHPKGWQAVTRYSCDESRVLIVLHGFRNSPAKVSVSLKHGCWKIDRMLGDAEVSLANSKLSVRLEDFTGCVVYAIRTS